MSQFCGSFCALTSRSLFTVMLYCATSVAAASVIADTPARAATIQGFRTKCRMSDLLRGDGVTLAQLAHPRDSTFLHHQKDWVYARHKRSSLTIVVRNAVP